ncbi:MAG: hypothetical protein IJY08_05355 [Clostridia bacterium]|nr:hypothetical protein [Clostridia bacterium]
MLHDLTLIPADASTDLTFSLWLQEKFTLHTQPRLEEAGSLLVTLEGIAAAASAFCAFWALVSVPMTAEQLVF